MKGSNWTESFIDEVRARVEELPHGQRSSFVERVAANMDCSKATVYRKISGGEIKRSREPEVPVAVVIKAGAMKAGSEKKGANGRQLATEDVISMLEMSGEIEPGSVSPSTIDRRLRELGWAQQRTYTRHEDNYVNEVHQMDFSRSEYFEVVDFSDGDYLLKVDGRRGTWAYKNKPAEERLRLWVVGYVDTWSRACLYRYFAATGENLMMATQFLSFAWQREDPLHPLVHLPETLKLDQGALGKNSTFKQRLKEDLGIRVELAAPKNDRLAKNQGMGKVERRFRTLWQRFELKQATILEQKDISTISLSDLNVLAHQHAMALLEKDHPHISGQVGDVYMSAVRQRKQRRLETDIYSLLYSDQTRTVNAYAEISIDKQLYKVPEKFTMQKIRVYTTPDGRLMGSGIDRKDTFELHAFDPAMAQGSRTHTPTIKEKAAEHPVQLDGSKLSVSAGSGQKRNGNIVHLPAREEQAQAESPFTAKARPIEAFTDWFECRKFICQVNQCRWTDLSEQAQHLYRQMFDTGRLTREIINDLAQTAS